MVLKTLAAMGPLHGYGIARRIEQIARARSRSTRGRSTRRCCGSSRRAGSASEWGTSENNRRARFYAITAREEGSWPREAESWARTVAMVKRMLEDES